MEAVAFFFALLALVFLAVGPAALIIALLSFSKVTKLERRIAELQASLAAARREGAFQRRRGAAPEPTAHSPQPTAPAAEDEPGIPPVAKEIPAPEAPEPPQAEPEPPVVPVPETPRHDRPTPATPTPRAAAKPPKPRAPAPSPRPRTPSISLEKIALWAVSSVGGFFLLVAGFLFFQFAIDKGWLGPLVRFLGGMSFGVVCLLAAELLWSKRYRLPAAGLGGAGIGILYAALYAGHSWYELFGVTIAFGLMALLTAVGVAWAVRRNSQFIAVLGLLGGYLTPVLLSTGDNRAVALFSYIGLLLAGLLFASVKRGWWTLAGLAGPATAAVLFGWGIKFLGADQAPVAFAAATGLGGLLWLAAWWKRTPRFVGWAAAVGVLLVHLAVLPYLMPLEPGDGVDPTALSAIVTGGHPWLAAGFLLLLAAALQALATRKRWPTLAIIGSVSLLPGLALFCLGWLIGVQPEPEWGDFGALQRGLGALYGLSAMPAATLPGVLLGSVGLAWLADRLTPALPGEPLTMGGKPVPLGAHHGPAVLLMVVCAVLILSVGDLGSAPVLVVLCAGLALQAWAVAVRPGPDWLPLPILAILTIALHGAMAHDASGLLAAGAAVVVVYLGAPFALAAGSATRALTRNPLPWLASALAGPLLFLPLHAGWEQALTADAIGLLPLSLGAGTVTAAVVLKDKLRDLGGRTLAVYVGVALLFACLAVPVQLDKQWWTVGWALEGAALAWMSRRVRHPGVVILSLLLMAAVTVRLVLNLEVLSYHPTAGTTLINWTLYGYGLPVLAMLAAAWWLRPTGEDDARFAGGWRWLRLANPTAVLMAVSVLFVLINLEVSAAFPEGEKLHLWSTTLKASMTRSISWAVYGLLLLLPGQRQDLRYLRPVALLFLLGSALKVFLLDLWQLEGIVRVGSLFGVAITLIAAAVAFQRLVLRDLRDEDETQEEAS